MEIHLTPEQEEQLAQIATKARTDAEGLVKDAALRLLEQDARFRAAVREGLRRPTGGVHRRRRNGRPPGADAPLITPQWILRVSAQLAMPVKTGLAA